VWREMPGPIHYAAVLEIQEIFIVWKGEQFVKLCGTTLADVYYVKKFKKNNKRCPDFAIWGPGRLDQCGRAPGTHNSQKWSTLT
jgi:hypothetical protein